jgi:uncharacterized protein with von Willebrand factor type A (vWA) domain
MKRDLSNFNLSLYIDKSGSMDGERWRIVAEAVPPIIRRMAAIDQDGITMAFFNTDIRAFGDNVTEARALEMFKQVEPGGGTSIVRVVSKAIELYNQRFHSTDKKELVVIITDGEDGEGHEGIKKIAKLIIDQTQKMENDSDLTLLFIQIGDDENATQWLKVLDDSLKGAGAKYDIIDVKTFEDLSAFDSFADALRFAIED